jgi:type I restriction enzyme S subunit
MVGSSGRQRVQQGVLDAYKILVPPLPEQIEIGRTLQALDDKIANNRKINHHLEQIAQAIFKSWFVDFEPFVDGGFVKSELGEIPIGWNAMPIETIAEKIAMGPFGSNIKVETFVETGVPIISGNHLRGLYLDELGYNFITEAHSCRLMNSLVRTGDIIFTHAGNIGQVALIPDDSDYPYYVISQRQFYLRCDRQKAVPEYITYYFHSREGQGKLLANASQTGVPSIARPSSHLKAIIVPIPPIKIQFEWLDMVKPMLQTLNNNNKENTRLASARDSLLPRLMSGELSVRDIGDVK